jgi:hypothetical protein
MGEVWLAARNDGRFEAHCAIKLLFDAAVLHLSNTVESHHPLLLQARQMLSTPSAASQSSTSKRESRTG